MRSLGFRYWLLFGCFLFCSGGVVAQDLKVLVLDALNGKPQANVKVEYFCVGPPSNSTSKAVLTDDKGLASISNFCSDQQKVEILLFPSDKKEQCGGDAGMSFSDVLSGGFLSHPDSAGGIWCPTKVSKGLKPVPGQVTLFVKKPTWYQSHIAG